MGGSSSQPQSADKLAEQGAQSSGTAEHQENARSAELLESQRRRHSHLHQMLLNARIPELPKMRKFQRFTVYGAIFLIGAFAFLNMIPDTGPEISRPSKAAEGYEDQIKLGEPVAQDHPANNAVVESKTEITAEKQWKNIGIPVASIISFIAGAIAAYFLKKCWDKYRQNGYERAEGENVQNNFVEQRAIPGPGGYMAEAPTSNTTFGEEVRPPASPVKPKGIFSTKKSRDEDRLDISKILARYTDLQLYRLTGKRHKQLESAIEDVVENISESLFSRRLMAEENLEKIRTLTRSNRRLDAAQLLLKSVLDGNVSECRMFWNILTEIQVNPQNLMTSLAQDVEEEAIHQHRNNLLLQNRNMKSPKSRLISDIFTDPRITVTQSEHDGNSETAERNNHIREVEIHELLKRRSSDTDKINISIVYGAAGTGKTTLIQKIIHDWAMGMKYDEFRFVLHFKIRNLNAIKGRITLSRLTVDAYPYLENYLEDLWKEPTRLLFIIDDLHQLRQSVISADDERNSDPRHRCSGPESNCSVDTILRSLLQGELLKGCSVLITARLWKQEMLRHITVDSTFQVMGFTFEKVKEYFCRYLRHDQYANEIVQLIEQNDILQNMCSNPLFCVTFASSLDSRKPQRDEQPTMSDINHTQLLFDYVGNLLRACGQDDCTTQKSLLQVGELAYKGIQRNTLLILHEANALRDLNTCPPNFTSAFMIQNQEKLPGGVVCEFTHSVLRDFLAALSNILSSSSSRLNGILDQTFTDPDGRFRTFSLFVVGLSSQNSVDRLELELGSLRSEVTLCTSQWLTERVKRRLANMDGKHTQRMFLHTLYCLLEFGDNEVMTEVLTAIKTIKLNQLLLTSRECAILSRTLIYSEEIKEMDLSSSLAQPEEIQKLEHLLHRCVILRLSQNNLQDSGVKRLINVLKKPDCKIETLELKSNHLTDDCLHTLFSALSANRSLTLLNLSNSSQDKQQDNQFTDERLQHHVDNYAQQKEIGWLRCDHTGQHTNGLILITE